MGLPMGFGKKQTVKKATISQAKLDTTKRDVGPSAPPPSASFPPGARKADSYPGIDNAESGPSSGNAGKKRDRDEFEGTGEPSGSGIGGAKTGGGSNGGAQAGMNDEDSDDDDGFDDEEETDPFPVSHEILLKDHTKVSLLSITVSVHRTTSSAPSPSRTNHSQCSTLISAIPLFSNSNFLLSTSQGNHSSLDRLLWCTSRHRFS